MTTTSLVIVLAAALFHALWNLAAKRAQGDSTIFVWMYFSGSALLCLPPGIWQLSQSDSSFGFQLLVAPVVSALLHIAYSMTLQTGYKQADLGIVYPVARGTGPLLSVLAAVAIFGERPAPLALVGGLIIIAGIVVVTGKDLLRGGSGRGAGLAYGVATGVAIAAYTLWDNHSVTDLGMPPIIYFGLSCLAQSLLMLPWVIHRRNLFIPTWRSDRREVIIVAVLSPLAYIMVLFAMTTTSVALVAPVRESSIVIGSLLAWWLFKEPDPLRRILGSVVVAIGIALVAVG
ncbi:DMT family transporter [Actinomycetaceae bacterium L2_0104]